MKRNSAKNYTISVLFSYCVLYVCVLSIIESGQFTVFYLQII